MSKIKILSTKLFSKNDDDGISLYDKVNLDFNQRKVIPYREGRSDFAGYVLGQMDCGLVPKFHYLVAVQLSPYLCRWRYDSPGICLALRKYGFYLSRQNFDRLWQNLMYDSPNVARQAYLNNCRLWQNMMCDSVNEEHQTYWNNCRYPLRENFVFHKKKNCLIYDALCYNKETKNIENGEYSSYDDYLLYGFVCCDKQGNLSLPTAIGKHFVFPKIIKSDNFCEASGKFLHYRFGEMNPYVPYFTFVNDTDFRGRVCGMVRHKVTHKKFYLGALYIRCEEFTLEDIISFGKRKKDIYTDYAFMISRANWEHLLMLKDNKDLSDFKAWVNDENIPLDWNKRKRRKTFFHIFDSKSGRIPNDVMASLFRCFIMDEYGAVLPVKDLDDYEIIASD